MITTPFEGLHIEDEAEYVINPFSGVSCKLEPEAVAVYDYIKGCEVLGMYGDMQKGLQWFRENFPDEYYKLLD